MIQETTLRAGIAVARNHILAAAGRAALALNPTGQYQHDYQQHLQMIACDLASALATLEHLVKILPGPSWQIDDGRNEADRLNDDLFGTRKERAGYDNHK